MKTYPVGSSIALLLPLADINGDPVEPTGLAYVITDHEGAEIVPSTTLPFVLDDTSVEIAIPASVNTLPAGVVSSGRVVILTITTLSGDLFRQEVVYRVQAHERLVPPQNSFQTDAGAQLLAADIPGLTAFEDATTPERQAALIEAHARITRVPVSNAPQRMPYAGRSKVYDRYSWPAVTADEFRSLDRSLVRALMRAQIQEANQILVSDPVRDRRRAGILSERVGESSITLSATKAIETAASPEAMTELAGFIVRGSISPHSVELIP